MRTRFLNNDPFVSFVSPDETLSFLNLPIPLLPPPRLPRFEPDLDSVPNVSPEIARLPIDSARCKFIAEVLPHKIEVDGRYFMDHLSRNSDICRPGHGSNEIWFSEAMQLLEHNESITEDKQTHRFEVIQFEVPELDAFLENNSYPEENMQILSKVPEIENDPDSLRPDLNMQHFVEVQRSVYATDCTTVEYDMDVEACLLEEDDTDGDKVKLRQSPFPLLEVDETSLRNLSNLCKEDEPLLSFEDIRSKDILLIDEMEPLGFVQYDVLEFLGDHCLSKQHLEYGPSAADLGMDIINLVERKDSENCSSPLSSHVFHDFEFLELDSSGIYCSFFAMQKPDEPETCDWMFRDNMNFKSFNELIVSCELALVDDTFKSMPVPIFSDDNKINSAYAVVEEMMTKIKPQPLSASHSIYLEWHLLEEDQCNSKLFSFYKTALEDFDPLMIDFDWESFRKGKGLLDIISSDDDFYGSKVEECKVSIHGFSGDIFSGRLNRGSPRMLSDEKCQTSGNGEQLTQAKTVEASVLFKSMSQFNDLEFFLNPGKAASGRKCEYAVEERGPHGIPAVHQDMDDNKLKEASNSLPIEDKHNVRTSKAADVERRYAPVQVPNVPCEVKFQQVQGCMISSLNITVVVNIQNLDKEMIVSRRSTYQKILALEKEGLQVVERDLELPVDIVLSPSTCLVWYNCRNIRKKVTGFDEASSCLPSCIENITADVLTLLSFSFSCCILTFEGDANFLSTVMEFSDGLYAAAASLRIDLQVFCSYSPELTDEIILNSIFYETKFSSRSYPNMPESETLAESFLTKFPSINPLTAHAILSSGGSLIQFFQCSKEQRIQEVQMCHVPEESISLFSALCSYGEREDSKSIMTDCSSSVSDTNKGDFNVLSETKPIRCTSGPERVGLQNGLWNLGPLKQFPDGLPGPGPIKQDDCSKSTDGKRLDDFGSPLEDLFGQKQRWDIPTMMDDASSVSKSCNFRDDKDTLVVDGVKRPRLYLNDELFDQNEMAAMNVKKRTDFTKSIISDNLREEFFDEVTDFTSSVDKDIPSTTDSVYFSTWLPEAEEDSTRKSKAARRLSFGQNSRPIFPTAKEIKYGTDLWPSAADISHSLQENENSYSDSDLPLKHSKRLSFNSLRHAYGGNSQESPFKDEMLHCGATPLSKAIQSTHSQAGSPWTIEFLNRIREKSRLRQQSLPPDPPNTDLVYSGNKTKITKRSPSILEFFKYKGGRNPEKKHEEKKQRQPKQPSSSSKSKKVTSHPFLPTWTPADKRSRQILSFATSDSGGQTRLVWSDGSGHHPIKKLRNQ